MAAHEDYNVLTRVGLGTPMGNLIRRYWIPSVMSEQIAQPGGAPVRVRLLGEDLVAYRDPDGQVGLIGEFCPHRHASLAYAQNERGGLRCLYHGWKMSCAGAVLETPAEPPESLLRTRVRHTAYPAREAGGIIWTYMGPAEKQPPFPHFPWFDLPASRVLVVKIFEDLNYLQGVEGDLDPVHVNYLHGTAEIKPDLLWQGTGWNTILQAYFDGAPKITCEETPYGFRTVTVRKTPDPKISYVRINETCAPFHTYVASGPNETRLFRTWHIADDVSCYTFYVHFDYNNPINAEEFYRQFGYRTSPPDYRIPYNRGNMHGQSRERMSTSASGIEGIFIQDLAIQESIGSYDRNTEHLGASDRAVIFNRRMLLRMIEANERGEALPALDPALDFQQRGIACNMPVDRHWNEAQQCQEDYEREHPAVKTG